MKLAAKLMGLFLLAWLLALPLGVVVLGTAQAAQQRPAAPRSVVVPRAAERHQLTLRREARRVWGLDAPIATFAAQVHQESRWREDARSPVGALGIAQFMPATAKWIGGIDAGLVERAPLNPTWGLRALVVYDHWLHERIRVAADDCERMAFTLAAYNGGLGWVYRRQQQARSAGTDPARCLGAACALNPGISPASQRENEHYPRAILLEIQPAYSRWGPGRCIA